MKVIKPRTLAITPAQHRTKSGRLLALAVYACFSLERPGPDGLLPGEQVWTTVAQAVGKGSIFDHAAPKPRAEVMAYGACRLAQPALASRVSLSMGPVDKKLAVTGDRVWTMEVPGQPEPFTSMDVSWRRAYGGSDFPENPLGMGRAKAKGHTPIPNILAAAEHPSHIGGELTPTSFEAYPPYWPQRRRHLGAFDHRWIEKDFPRLPESTDPLFHMAAPPDQWMDGFFHGDEAFTVENMHPDHPTLHGQLPGVRVRVFVTTKGQSLDSFREVAAHADTLWLFPNQLVGVLRRMAAFPVDKPDGDDIQYVLARTEPLDQAPAPAEHYREVLRRQVSPEAAAPPPPTAEPAVQAPPSEPAAPLEESPAPTEAATGTPEAVVEEDPEVAAFMAELDRIQAEAREQLARSGLSEEQAIARMEQLRAPSTPTEDIPGETFEQAMERLAVESRRNMSESGLTSHDMVMRLEKLGTFHKQESLEHLAERLDRGGVPAGAAPHVHEALDAFAAFMAALPAPGPAPEPAKEAPETAPGQAPEAASEEQPAVAWHVTERYNFEGRDLTGVDFTERNLTSSNFRNAVLVDAVFHRTELDRADFTGAVLTGADCQDCTFTNAQADKVCFEGTNLPRADMRGCMLAGANLLSANMAGANLSDAQLQRAVLRDASAKDLIAERADFTHADLSDADFDFSNIKEAIFTSANLDDTVFRSANAEGARFNGAGGRGVRMRGARLANSRADERSSFRGGNLRETDLAGAQWIGADLTEANLWKSNLNGASFSKAKMESAVLKRCVAKRADFSKAVLDLANMRRINLFLGSLRAASLKGARIKRANLYGVDLCDADTEQARFDETNLKRTLLDPERAHA